MVYTLSVVDVKEYISSGILESVVLGFASEQEKQEVSCLMHIYPEIREEFRTVEQSVEKIALETAIAPGADMKQRILNAISTEAQLPAGTPAAIKETKIVQMPAPAEQSTAPNPWKWMAAASIVLLFGTAALWISSNKQAGNLSERLAAIESEKEKGDQVLTAMKMEQERTNAIQQVLTEKSTKNVTMAGMPMEPKATVRVMWSANDQKAVMVAESITPPPSDMQYQLWAIADGKPVSLGVFNYDDVMAMTEPFDVSMNNISAFAITLEKRGGSATPTMDKMVVMGAVNS